MNERRKQEEHIMKKEQSNGYRKFRKLLIAAGIVAGLAALHLIFAHLIPFIGQMHGR
jgi:hypothetical protein